MDSAIVSHWSELGKTASHSDLYLFYTSSKQGYSSYILVLVLRNLRLLNIHNFANTYQHALFKLVLFYGDGKLVFCNHSL